MQWEETAENAFRPEQRIILRNLPICMICWRSSVNIYNTGTISYRYTWLTSHHPLMIRPSYAGHIPVYNAYRLPSYNTQTILHRSHTGIHCLPGIILWWSDHPTWITCRYTLLTRHHPMMIRSSYMDHIPVYSAYQISYFYDQTILHRSHIGIQCLPDIVFWWPDHPTRITYRYTVLTDHHPVTTRSSYTDYLSV